jgi:hypothetical protein
MLFTIVVAVLSAIGGACLALLVFAALFLNRRGSVR